MEALTVGVLAPYLAGSYFGGLIAAIARVVWAAGGRVVSVQTARPGMELQEGLATKSRARVGWDVIAGFVVIGDATESGYVAELEQAGKVVVTIAHDEPALSCPQVMVDNRGGILRAVEHLLWHGHTRVAFVGCMDSFDVRERYESYQGALAAHGVEVDPALLYEVADNVESGGLEAGGRMLAAGLPSSAVVVGTDLNALGVSEALKAAGLRLPEDQAVTGFDNGLSSSLMTPALSTASQDLHRVGGTAAHLLLRRLGGEDVAGGVHLVDAPFVVRESCGCAMGTRRRGHDGGVTGGNAPSEVLYDDLAGVPGTRGGATALPVADLADSIGRVIASAAEGELGASDLEGLRSCSEQLYASRPGQVTGDLVLAFAEQVAAQVGEGATVGEEVNKRLEDCRSAVRLGITRAALIERTQSYYAMRRAVRDEYLIVMDLVGGHREGDPRGLGWVRRTEAHAAVLGLWEGGLGASYDLLPGGGKARGGNATTPLPCGRPARWLEMASTFRADGGRLEVEGTRCDEESFPPEELLEAMEEGCVAAVIPISSDHVDWGLLAIVTPAEPAYIGQDMYFTWAALFAEVLDRQALTSSLLLSEERYALAARAANDGLWDWDLARGSAYYSDRWKEMLGFADGAIGDGPEEWLGRVHHEDRQRLLDELSSLRVGRFEKVALEHRVRVAGGELHLGTLPCARRARRRLAGGAPGGFAHRRYRTPRPGRTAAAPSAI
jgi:DNA-binding LacI/PurR family transcriptional regulator/PAS domain-containing protein